MTEYSPTEIALAFIETINRHDVDKLCRMMSDDHVFIDSLGSTVKGKDAMRRAWIQYFFLIPDYTIVFDNVMTKGNAVAVFGRARGTCAVEGTILPGNAWSMPIALCGIIRDGLVAQWQVYADNEPVRQIIASTH